jgi:phage terminase large subunit-like protein
MSNFIINPDLYPDPSGRAERICKFISNLKVWEGDFAGENFFVNPFQECIVKRIYGPCAEDGSRLTRIAVIWIPRGNSKTTSVAALGLAHFMGPEAEAGGQVICAAADRGNAGIAFNHGFQMVNQDKELYKRIEAVPSLKEMRHKRTKSLFKAISTESYSKHGLNVSFFLADEIHAWPPTEARKLWKVITDSMGKRSNPLTVVISTAGEGMGGLAREMWDYSHDVSSGKINDPTFAPIIFEAPNSECDWRDETNWKIANPVLSSNFGGSLLKELRNKVSRVQYFPQEVVDFKRFHLNIWIDGSSTPWIEMEVYDKCEERTELEEIKKNKRKGYVGVDLSSVEDLTAVVAVFPDYDDDEERGFDVLPMFFLPEESLIKKADRDQAKYVQWKEEGFLRVTPGNRIDQNKILEYCDELDSEFEISEFAVDRWNSTAFITNLQDKGYEVIEFGQGFSSMAGPVKEIKSTILSGKFRHGNNPILRMCFANVVTEKDSAENEKFTKSKARGRIDGATGAAMAIGRILSAEGDELENYRGIYSNDEDYEGVFGRKKERELELINSDPNQIDYEILNNMRHPMFEEMKQRFERFQDMNRDRDDF